MIYFFLFISLFSFTPHVISMGSFDRSDSIISTNSPTTSSSEEEFVLPHTLSNPINIPYDPKKISECVAYEMPRTKKFYDSPLNAQEDDPDILQDMKNKITHIRWDVGIVTDLKIRGIKAQLARLYLQTEEIIEQNNFLLQQNEQIMQSNQQQAAILWEQINQLTLLVNKLYQEESTT